MGKCQVTMKGRKHSVETPGPVVMSITTSPIEEGTSNYIKTNHNSY
jgi:hypothetical protein